MGNYKSYKDKVEKKYNQDLKEILTTLYITNEQGPSVSAKQLGIPRQVFMHFVNHYGLKPLKLDDIKKKVLV
ncbi:hypothetical protein [Planomicrobium sp. CPCC 101110]|uniref:hypothetical protein n=1 Tax=Planomicrobium sp. CPCC 101110 TaxID=2599619 RepID=UPI0011B50C1F|nr:hypothetical protein [Planomicrobium sp. CPCC 101110]TWT27708.1 hypothetical protein FQV30_04120 [Planomicrobium sp. CPCC 101110]